MFNAKISSRSCAIQISYMEVYSHICTYFLTASFGIFWFPVILTIGTLFCKSLTVSIKIGKKKYRNNYFAIMHVLFACVHIFVYIKALLVFPGKKCLIYWFLYVDKVYLHINVASHVYTYFYLVLLSGQIYHNYRNIHTYKTYVCSM